MRYASPVSFRTALEQRLLTHSRASGLSLDRLRKQVVFDRLLARLLVAAPNRWVLKGGFALDLRLGAKARSTRDVDLARQDDAEQATADFLAAQSVDLGDAFVFAVERTNDLDEAFEGAAVRYRATASLAGRRFEHVLVDVGFGDPMPLTPDVLAGSGLLAFAGVEQVQFPAIPLEQHVAEKVHAYTRIYGIGQRQSTRVKDLVDLIIVARNQPFRAGALRQALLTTFGARGAQQLPEDLPLPPGDWREPYQKLAREVGIDADVASGYARAAAFLNPALRGELAGDAHWHPEVASWAVEHDQTAE